MYTEEELIKEITSLPDKRTRRIVDQRGYLIGILIYKFLMSEQKIADLCNLKRCKVHYNKFIPIWHQNNEEFLNNTEELRNKYPYDFVTNNQKPKTSSNKTVKLVIDNKTYNKLKSLGFILGHDDIRITIKKLISKSITLMS